MQFLKRAQDYAEAQGDGNWFAELYTGLRETHSIAESTWQCLVYLYGDTVAQQLLLERA